MHLFARSLRSHYCAKSRIQQAAPELSVKVWQTMLRKLIFIVLFYPGMAFSDVKISGEFEQVDLFSAQMPTKELQERFIKTFEKQKLVLKFSDKSFNVVQDGEDTGPVDYRVEGNTIISQEGSTGLGIHWILYVADKNTLYSTGLKFVRVKP